MKGNETMLCQFLEGSSKRFIIPVYQRNYDWQIDHCKQLYDDLLKIHYSKADTHFFGSIVSASDNLAMSEYLIIDGQQRLTTISLLLNETSRAYGYNRMGPKIKSSLQSAYNKLMNLGLGKEIDGKLILNRVVQSNKNKCPNCHYEIEDSAAFCRNCGVKIKLD